MSKITIQPAAGTIVVRAGGAVIAESTNALTLSEEGHADVWYLPRADVGMEFFERSEKVTHCPWKGDATHFHFAGKSQPIQDAAWSYDAPLEAVAQIKDHLAFYGDKLTVERI